MAMTFRFAADGSQYARGLDKMRGQTKAFAGGVTKMMGAMFAGGALIGLKMWADGLDRIHKLSQRLGQSTDSLQRLAYAAELNGTNMETAANAITKIQQNAGQAANGLKTYSDAFDRLGISSEEFIKLKPEEQMIEMARAYQNAQKSGTGVADVLTILGGRAKEILPLLSQTPEELRRVFDEASVASENSINKMVEWNDKWTSIKNTIAGFLSWFFDSFQAVATVVGAAVGAIVGIWMGAFKAIADGAAATGNLVMNALTGNLEEAKKNLGQMEDAFTGFYKNIAKQASAADQTITEEIGRIYGVGKRGQQPSKPTETGKKGVDTGVIHGPREGVSGRDFADPSIQATDPYAQKSFFGPGGAPAEEEKLPSIEDSKSKKQTTSIVASSLASIGGGGGSAAFRSDPALSEAQKQTTVLEEIAMNTKPPGGTPTTPEL